MGNHLVSKEFFHCRLEFGAMRIVSADFDQLEVFTVFLRPSYKVSKSSNRLSRVDRRTNWPILVCRGG